METIAVPLERVNTPPYGDGMKKRLEREDWISAGLRALAADGVEAVRVERLAAALKVTKGSFYWHFKDRPALLAALLDAWKARATQDVITTVDAGATDPLQRLRALFALTVPNDGRLDLAVRAWAAQDVTAQAALDEIDARRLGYLETQFLALGFPAPAASARARFAYQALIGQFMMDKLPPEARAAERLDLILPMLTRL